jgi:hypothetical protein
MIKKYMKPETIVVSINLSNLILAQSEVDPENMSGSTGGSDGAEDDNEYSRSDSNGGNIWDNAW